MKHTYLLAALLCAMPLFSQANEKSYKGHGYAYYAIGGLTSGGEAITGAGAGGEALFWKGLGAGAELGYLFPAEAPKAGFGLLSVNPAWHFARYGRSSKFVPFATGGWSLAFREGSQNLYNYGAGVTWWFRDRLGLRLEVRDHRCTNCSEGLVLFRASLAFR
jgi:hypothetical protein